MVVHVARNGFFYALDRVNGSFIHGKQYVNELKLDDRPSIRRPAARSTTIPPRMCRNTPRAAMVLANPDSNRSARSYRRQELGARRL